jgi:hypothetical protein
MNVSREHTRYTFLQQHARSTRSQTAAAAVSTAVQGRGRVGGVGRIENAVVVVKEEEEEEEEEAALRNVGGLTC